MGPDDEYDAIIIGAGASGIGAAITFQEKKLSYLILEARGRVGGRVLTEKIDGVEMDLGACWVHSFSEKNPILKEVQRLQWKQGKLGGSFFGRKLIDGQIGQQFDQTTTQVAHYHFQRFFDEVQKNSSKMEKDCTLYEGAKDYYDQVIEKLPANQKRLVTLLINMTEHYEASSIKELSMKNYDETTDTGGDFSPDKGYGSLLQKISQRIQHRIKFNTEVIEINYDDKVSIRCSGGAFFKAKKIIAGVPLGLLKNKFINFTPELPEHYQKSIQNLGVGLMNKILVSFTENFWGNSAWLSIGCEERGKFSHFYNFSQNGKHILCCFITDDFARKAENLSDEVIMEDFLSLLKKIYKTKKVQVSDYKITRWGKQKYSLGSYSSFHVNSSPDDCYLLRKPINNNLWLVGEHCYAEHIGTAHGAFKTGIWAAEQVMKKLKWF